MPRDRKAKAAAQVPAPAVTPEAPAPAEQQGNRSPLSAATGTDHKGLQNALLSDVVAALGIPSDSEAHATRSGAAVGMMAGFAPRDAIEGALAAQSLFEYAISMACPVSAVSILDPEGL